ncbi:MAG: signal peptidase II [Acidimicrobiia bacterium]
MSNDAAEPAPVDRSRLWLVAVVVVVVVVALDQLTKIWAVHALVEGQPVEAVGSLLQWQLSYNPGAAFGILQAFTPILAVVAVAIAVFLVRAVRRAKDMLLVVALSLVLGGALGNLIDRVARADGFLDGKVVDFIRLPHWPMFNIADMAITCGAVLLVWWGLRRPDDNPSTATPDATP